MVPERDSPFSKPAKMARKRGEIISVASELFNSAGASTTTLEDVAASLNRTKTSLYHYVKTKEELVYLCYTQACDYYRDLLARANRAKSGKAKIILAFRLYASDWRDVQEGKRPNLAVLTEIPLLSDDHRRDIVARFISLVTQMREFVVLGIDDGSVSVNSRTTAAISLFNLLQWMSAWLPGIGVKKLDAMLPKLGALLTTGISNSDNGFSPAISLEEGIERALPDTSTESALKLDAFLTTGTRLFNQRGYKGVSLDMIAQSLGVTKGAFYYYIKNKDELLDQCFVRTMLIIEQWQTFAKQHGRSGLEMLQIACFGLFLSQQTSNGKLVRAGLYLSLPPEKRLVHARDLNRIRDGFAAMIRTGRRDGSLKEVDTAVTIEVILGLIDSCADFATWRPQDDPADGAQLFFEPLFEGLTGRRR